MIKDLKKFFRLFNWTIKKIKSAYISIILITILGAISSVLYIEEAMVSKYLIDSAISTNLLEIKKYLIMLISIIIIQMIIGSISSIIATKAHERLRSSIQNSLYTHILNSKWIDSSKYGSVDYLSRLTDDVNSLCNLALTTIPSIISFIVLFITAFIALVNLSPALAFASITIFPLFLLLGKFFGKIQKRNYILYKEENVRYNSYIQETLKNLVISKTFTLENLHISKIKEFQKNKENISVKQCIWSIISGSILEIGSTSGYILSFIWGIANLSKGINAFGTLIAIMQLFDNIQRPFIKLAKSIPKIINTLASCERLIAIENLSLEKNTYVKNTIKYRDDFKIKLNNISYRYPKIKEYVLKDISLEISSGEKIAIIGQSGQGKTTLIRLLLSLINPTNGDISIKQNELLIPFTKEMRKYIAYIPQENTLISGNIKDNILYGNLNANEADITSALALANAKSFIMNTPNKLETIINENSGGISGGQAQRICIARAFLKKAPIIILDEATSALDKDSELHILESLKNLDYNPTIIIITHKDAALDYCDSIYKLKHGSLIKI